MSIIKTSVSPFSKALHIFLIPILCNFQGLHFLSFSIVSIYPNRGVAHIRTKKNKKNKCSLRVSANSQAKSSVWCKSQEWLAFICYIIINCTSSFFKHVHHSDLFLPSGYFPSVPNTLNLSPLIFTWTSKCKQPRVTFFWCIKFSFIFTFCIFFDFQQNKAGRETKINIHF